MIDSLRGALEYTKIYWEIHIETRNLDMHMSKTTHIKT